MSKLKADVIELRRDCKKLRESVSELLSSGMKEKTVLVLLNHYTKVPQKTIKTIMDGMHDIELVYFGEQEN